MRQGLLFRGGRYTVEIDSTEIDDCRQLYDVLRASPELSRERAFWIGAAMVLLLVQRRPIDGKTQYSVQKEFDQFYLGTSAAERAASEGKMRAIELIREYLRKPGELPGAIVQLMEATKA